MSQELWERHIRGRHTRLVNLWAERLGMRTSGFREAMRRRLSLEPWRSDGAWDGSEDSRDETGVLDLLKSGRYLPDAYRFIIEGTRHGWGRPVLVIEVLEVAVTNPTVGEKLAWYENLWWACDGTNRLEFRAVETWGEDDLEELMGQRQAYALASQALKREGAA